MPITTIAIKNNTPNIVRSYCQGVTKDIAVPATSDHDEHQYEEDVKKRILGKALEFVTKSGWSVDSLARGAEAAGYPGVSHGLFPNGGGDLVHYFNVTCNEKLVEEMKTVSCNKCYLNLAYIFADILDVLKLSDNFPSGQKRS